MKMTALQEARFLKKFAVRPDGCWEWSAATVPEGYGVVRIDYKLRRAHRVAYEHWREPIEGELQLDHLCRNRLCVNPAHLEAVSQRENILRGHSIVAERATRTHCPSGHEYAGDNLFFSKRGQRLCRACSRIHSRATHARRKAR